MMRSGLMICVVGATIASSGASASAFEIRQRFVHRFQNQDLVINGDSYSLFAPFPNTPVRIRIQFGVFDSDTGPAPEGGFIGWNVGAIATGFSNVFTYSRTPGRLSPFTFASGPSSNGSPTQDPFHNLTDIDATLGLQTPLWPAGSDPDSPPLPIIRGRNTFISVYEITLSTAFPIEHPVANITFGGNMIAASEWRTVGTPNPPTPDEPGSITYAPFPLPPVGFSRTLHVQIFPDSPSPGAGAGLVIFSAGLAMRRRRRN
jgi:hypothetical protein